MSKQIIKRIQFHYLDQRFYLPNRTALKYFIHQIFKREGVVEQEINYIFCSDAYLFKLNNRYLKHKTYTDIITFQYSWSPEPIFSDIYISIERVKENAATHNSPFVTEIRRVMFHGALHLCGYKDKTGKDSKLMRDKEDFYLNLYNVSRGTRRVNYKRLTCFP